MKRSLIAALVAALSIPALPALAQTTMSRPGPVTGGSTSVEQTLANDRAQIDQDKAAIANDQKSGMSTADDQQKLERDMEHQETDRGAEERGTGAAGDPGR